jgi:ataxin-10
LYSKFTMYVSLSCTHQHVLQQFLLRSDEIITPHQTTLLKIIDSYLQSSQASTSSPVPQKMVKTYRKLSPMLLKIFLDLSAYGRASIERALGRSKGSEVNGLTDADTPHTTSSPSASSNVLKELDPMLPKVCEALVLVTQCIVAISLEAESPSEDQETPSRVELKTFFIETRVAEVGVVDSLIGTTIFVSLSITSKRLTIPCTLGLLRELDLFLPRINFGRPVSGPSATASGVPSPSIDSPTGDGSGFSYLKRDFTRLLGILSHESKAVQDRVRECGGIPVVMNMCVIDERNPCGFRYTSAF